MGAQRTPEPVEEIVRALRNLGLEVMRVEDGTPDAPGVHIHVVIPSLENR